MSLLTASGLGQAQVADSTVPRRSLIRRANVSDDLHKPGEIADDSGQYRIVGPRGGDTGEGERTVTSGEPFPPTPQSGQRFRLVDRTQHRGKR